MTSRSHHSSGKRVTRRKRITRRKRVAPKSQTSPLRPRNKPLAAGAASQAGGPRRPTGKRRMTLHQFMVLVTTYTDGEFKEETMALAECIRMGTGDVDYYHDEVRGLITIRTKSGEPLEYSPELPGNGPVSSVFRRELMQKPGVYQTPRQLSQIPALTFFQYKGVMPARLTAMRKVFGERDQTPWFFLARRKPYSVCWNPERSWRTVQWIPEPEG